MYEKINVRSVLIEVTNVCNLNCKHCYNSFDRGNISARFLSLPRLKEIIEKCSKYQLDKLYISGGEPLCHPKIMEIIKLCGKYPDIHFTITTNGLLLTDSIIKEIEKSDNICVQLSVDGLTKEVYEQQRGEKSFSNFKKALNLLLNSKIKYLTARTCVTKINYKEVSYIYEFLLENKIIPSFLFVNKMGNAEKNWDKLHLDMSMQLHVLNDINALNIKHKTNITPPEPVSTCNFTEGIEVKSLLIKFDGNVAPCQFFYSDSIGNIFTMDISEILNYENLKHYYDLARKRKEKLDNNSNCKNCKINQICSYGCLGLASSLGNPLGMDGLCSFRVMTCAMYSNKVIAYSRDTQLEEENLI